MNDPLRAKLINMLRYEKSQLEEAIVREAQSITNLTDAKRASRTQQELVDDLEFLLAGQDP